MNALYLLQVAEPQASAQGGGSPMFTFITFGAVILIFYFFIIRPQNKKQKEAEKMIAALKKGDKIVTIGGIHGNITNVKEHTVVVKVDDGCKIEFNRSAIASVVNTQTESTVTKKDKKN